MITPGEVDPKYKVAYGLQGEYYVLRYTCARCGKSDKRMVHSDPYMQCIDDKATRKDVSSYIIQDTFLSESSTAEQVYRESLYDGEPIDIHEVIEFGIYIGSADALRDLLEETAILEEEISSEWEQQSDSPDPEG